MKFWSGDEVNVYMFNQIWSIIISYGRFWANVIMVEKMWDIAENIKIYYSHHIYGF